MVGNYMCNLNEIEGVDFYRGSKEIGVNQLGDFLYSPLEELILFNRDARLNSSNPFLEDPRRKNLYQDVQSHVRNTKGFSAFLYFGGGKRELFEVKPRTNFRDTLTKRPNIIFLAGGNNNTLVLREARNYEGNPLVYSDAKSFFKKNYAGNYSSGEEDSFKNKVFSIPEPGLILALEQIHKTLGIPRIIPKFKVLDANEANLYYLRNSLLSIQDGPFNSESLIFYEGVLNGLGLMDVLDAQYAHYCLNDKGDVVNIDPDFFSYSSSLKHIDNYDWNHFKKNLRPFYPEIFSDSNLNKTRRKIIEETQEKLGDFTLLDFVPESFSQAPLSKRIKKEVL
jgi:hypothetical protein